MMRWGSLLVSLYIPLQEGIGVVAIADASCLQQRTKGREKGDQVRPKLCFGPVTPHFNEASMRWQSPTCRLSSTLDMYCSPLEIKPGNRLSSPGLLGPNGEPDLAGCLEKGDGHGVGQIQAARRGTDRNSQRVIGACFQPRLR